MASKEVAVIPVRSLPRCFVPGASASQDIALPKEEIKKLTRVLRLAIGDQIAILPNDGTLIVATFEGETARPIRVIFPNTESSPRMVVAQALPKGDKLDEIVRACTELGVHHFVLFSSDRSVVKWDAAKFEAKLGRLRTIATEACEVSYRTIVPTFEVVGNLDKVLRKHPEAIVLSETQDLDRRFRRSSEPVTIVVGPEGGWSANELALAKDRAVSLGPRVLRTDHAAMAAAAIQLLSVD